MRDTSRQLALAIARALQLMALILLAAYSLVWSVNNLSGFNLAAAAFAIVSVTLFAWVTIKRFIEPRLKA